MQTFQEIVTNAHSTQSDYYENNPEVAEIRNAIKDGTYEKSVYEIQEVFVTVRGSVLVWPLFKFYNFGAVLFLLWLILNFLNPLKMCFS